MAQIFTLPLNILNAGLLYNTVLFIGTGLTSIHCCAARHHRWSKGAECSESYKSNIGFFSHQIIFDCLLAYCQKHSCKTKELSDVLDQAILMEGSTSATLDTRLGD